MATDAAPRTFAALMAQRMGVSVGYAEQYLRRMGGPPLDTDAELRAIAASAEAKAWATVTDTDMEDFAATDDPERTLLAWVDELTERNVRTALASKDANERRLIAQLAANTRWAHADREEATQRARDAFMARFEREVDPDGRLSPQERQKRAENARKAYMQRLSLKSAQSRRRRGRSPRTARTT